MAVKTVDLNPLSLWRRVLALPNESRTKTLTVAFAVSLVCALLVTGTTVLLQPVQEANRAAERQARLDAMIVALPGMGELLATTGADSLTTVVVELDTGRATELDPASFDARSAATDPATSIAIPADADVAGLGRRAHHALMHILRDDRGNLQMVVLPVSAAGYRSVVYAYLALESDLNTVAAVTIVEQSDTPGIGTRIENPDWLALWTGKQVADASGQIRLAVVSGTAGNEYEVDGISGATRTANALTNMIRYWLGEHGFGPALARLRAGEL